MQDLLRSVGGVVGHLRFAAPVEEKLDRRVTDDKAVLGLDRGDVVVLPHRRKRLGCPVRVDLGVKRTM